MMLMDCGEQILSFTYGGAFNILQDCYHASECFLLQSNNHSALHFPFKSVFLDLWSFLPLSLETLPFAQSPSPESSLKLDTDCV